MNKKAIQKKRTPSGVLFYFWKKVAFFGNSKKFSKKYFISHIVYKMKEGNNMAKKKLRYEMSKKAYIDNDIIRSSDAFRNLNSWLMQLIYLCCCK